MHSQDLVTQGEPQTNGRVPVGDAATVLERVRSGDIRTVIVGGCDTNGVFRAKRLPSSRFAAGAEPTAEFSEYMWVMDLDEVPQPRPADFTGWWPDWTTGFGDIQVVIDAETLRAVPWLDRTAVALGTYRHTDGRDVALAPRNVLRRVLERYERAGLTPRMAAEFEFHVFRESEASAAAKGFRDLQALSPRPMAYGAMQSTLDDRVIGAIVEQLTGLRVPVEAWAPEGGPGQYELNLCHAPALEAADQAFLFKHAVKELCALDGLTATFMPKLDVAGFGSSLHVHQSLWHDADTSAFHDSAAEECLSSTLRSFVAGQLATISSFAPLWLPTPTAYKRTVPHTGAGTTETWGGDNKTVSLRVLAHEAAACRVEHRVPGSDANVYLALAGMLAGGLHGIERELELGAATTGDAYSNPDVAILPRTLGEAISIFEQDPVANEYLGEEFVRYYAATRRWEIEQMQDAITDWELRRYFGRS